MRKFIIFLLLFAMILPAQGLATETVENFKTELEASFKDPDRIYNSDVRWWLADAGYTDEVLLQEIQAMYDGGYHGVELCMQNGSAPDELYAYGSEMWSHKWKLMMNKLLDLGMEVSLTSGTNWSTSNVPGLDPDSQGASQVIALGDVIVAAGETITSLPKPDVMRETNAGKFVGAYAFKLISVSEIERTSRNRTTVYPTFTVDYDTLIDLNGLDYTEGETVYDQACEWTAPTDGDYIVFAYWTHGNYKTASPAAQTCYATNYFDVRGVEALRTFWEANYLNDPELNAKILNGDVQLFMDSLEITPDGGFTWWTEDMRDEFIRRKGYDILPYLFLAEGLPQVFAVYNPYYPPAEGFHKLAGKSGLREKIINDWVDVLTQMNCEKMLVPLKEWLNSVGIKTRAQISYGRSWEITEPSLYVDFPEAENFNQYNNVDIFRLHTAGAKLQNKVLSTETGAAMNTYATTFQRRLNDIYAQYAAGFQRVIWHIWSSSYAYGTEFANTRGVTTWPGWGSGFDRLGNRETNFRDSDEFNAHVGRVQKLLQTGTSRTDIGFIHNNWNQGIRFGGGIENDLTAMNYMLAHMGVYYRSTELQDNGYTYDYLSPDLLKAETVYFDEATATIEPAGYKALVVYQNWLDADGAKTILDWAQKGLKVVFLEGAAQRTPFNDGRDDELAATVAEIKALDTVRTAEIYDKSEGFDYFLPLAEGYNDNVYETLQELSIRPYAGYIQPNHQLLTQSRVDENGNMYLYVYNYCSNDYHHNSHIEAVQSEDHGTNIQTEVKMDGTYVPMRIDAWSGKVTELAEYRYENGQTIFPIDLDYANIALYAFEKIDGEKLHIVDANLESYAKNDELFVRATQSGSYNVTLSNGETKTFEFDVPAFYDITGWKLNVESWTAGNKLELSEETIGDLHTVTSKVSTNKTPIEVQLDKLMTWNNIPEVGMNVSGLGRYEAVFNWDAKAAAGAYLDFGEKLVSSMKVWINDKKVGGDISEHPSKKPVSIVEGYEAVEAFTGGISWFKPIVDISEYLVDGENTIVIEYSSSLTNVALSLGIISETQHGKGWWNNNTNYFEYGPSQAVIIPFVEAPVK